MSRSRLGHPSPALVVSFIALLVALGGTSYAAFSLPKHSVGTKQLKKAAVTNSKIANGAVTARKVNPTGLTVPNALHANNATTAGSANLATNAANAANANKVNGLQVKQFFFKGGANAGPSPVLNVDGIVLKAGCDSHPFPLATLENDSGVGATLEFARWRLNSVVTVDDDAFGATPSDLLGADNVGSGEFAVTRTDGTVINGSFMFRASSNFNGEDVCTVSGSVIAS